ncbi:MAG: hypothetical protein ACK5V3_12985 [Bdellovibrionales bacterium]
MISIISLLLLFFQVHLSAKDFNPKRFDDSKIKLNKEWIKCQQDADCVGIHYGCGGHSSANKIFSMEAQKKAYQDGGDSRAMNCEIRPSKNSGPIEYECRMGLCGAYQYPACEDEDCKNPFPKCLFESKWKPESEGASYSGGSSRPLWGLTKEACRSACELQFIRLKDRLSQPIYGHHQIYCHFKDKVIYKESLK